MHVWLVQRGSLKDVQPSPVEGIDALVAWHYMGASEFEWGGLHGSLKRIVAELDQYEMVPSGVIAKDGRALAVYCRRDRRVEVRTAIQKIGAGAVRLKAPAHLDRVLAGTSRRDVDFWWDIEHDWMAWLGEDRPVVRAIEAVAARWRMRA